MSVWFLGLGGLSPALVLGLLLSVGYASLLHVLGGRSLRELVIFCMAAALGFTVGQFFGAAWGHDPLQIGQVHVLAASTGAWILLIGAYYLTR